MNRLGKCELICHAVVVGLITLLYVVLGLVLLFGPADTRLARNSATLVPAFMWVVATWFFYCVVSFVLFRIIFFGVRFVLRKRLKPNQTVQATAAKLSS